MAKPIGDEYLNVSAALDDIGAKSNLYRSDEYRSDEKGARQLYFTPFFAFAADAEGRPEVTRQSPAPGKVDHRIQLRLLISPEAKLTSMAAYARSAADGEYPDLRRTALIPIPMQRFRVVQVGDVPVFQRVDIQDRSLQGNVVIESAPLSEQDAMELAQALESGGLNPRFLVTYELDAVFRKSVSSAAVKSVDAYTTDAVQRLVGEGRAFRWETKGATGALGADQVAVTRDQKASFEGALRREIEVDYVVGDPEDFSVLRENVDAYVKAALTPVQLDPTNNFAADLARLSAYGFNATDLAPDQIDRLVSSVKEAFQSEDQTKIDTSVAAKGSFLGIGGSAEAGFKLDELMKRMEEKGWQFEVDGDVKVPKSLEVYVVNKTALRQDGRFAISVRRNIEGLSRQAAEVSLKNVLSDPRPQAVGLTSVPLGSIVDWYPLDKVADIPYGFQLCDGSEITDERSPYAGKPTPALVDRMAMGVTAARLGEQGGRNDIPADGAHSHVISYKGYARGQINYSRGKGHKDDYQMQYGAADNGSHAHGGDNRPAFIGVLKIIRIL